MMAIAKHTKNGTVNFKPSIAMLLFFKSYFMRRFEKDKFGDRWREYLQAMVCFDEDIETYLIAIRRPHHKDLLDLFDNEVDDVVRALMRLESAVDRMYGAFADRDGLPTPPPPGWFIDPLHVDYQGP